MGFGELFVLAVGLAMDAFAVAVCKGLALKRSVQEKHCWSDSGSEVFRG